jgi:hypothetical protein
MNLKAILIRGSELSDVQSLFLLIQAPCCKNCFIGRLCQVEYDYVMFGSAALFVNPSSSNTKCTLLSIRLRTAERLRENRVPTRVRYRILTWRTVQRAYRCHRAFAYKSHRRGVGMT